MSDPTPVTSELLAAWPLPQSGSDKGSRGHVVVVGGNRSTPGALLLSGESALRVGAGRLQLMAPRSVAVQVAVALPEAGVVGLPETASGDLEPAAVQEIRSTVSGCDCVLVGPGLMDPSSAPDLVAGLVAVADGPVVVDALGSCFVTHDPDGLRALAGRCVLTVNPTELARCLGVDDDEVGGDPGGATARLAQRTGAVVLCGGPDKHVASPKGERWVVTAGGPGLGIAGSGDVQAGLVAGLLARGAEPDQAAVWGGYLHAVSGDRLAETVAPLGFLARDLPGVVPGLLAELSREGR